MTVRTAPGVKLLFAGLLLSAAAPLMAADKPLLQEGKKTLYQRVLTTPTCQLRGHFLGHWMSAAAKPR